MSRKSNTQRDIERENVELRRLVSKLKKQIKKYDSQDPDDEEDLDMDDFIEEKKDQTKKEDNYMTFVLLNGEVRKIPKRENQLNR